MVLLNRMGDRIGQLIIIKTEDIQWEEVDSFEDSDGGIKDMVAQGMVKILVF